MEYDRKLANSIINDLEVFSTEGWKELHPSFPSFDLTGKRKTLLRRIAEKHYKWLDSKSVDGNINMSWETVRNAHDAIALLKLYGFVRAMIKKRLFFTRK